MKKRIIDFINRKILYAIHENNKVNFTYEKKFREYNMFLKEVDGLRLKQPDNPACFAYKTFSQNEEDGIIQNCIDRIGKISKLSKTFIEIGCGNGIENNTHQLLLNGFRGVWIDGDKKNIDFIKNNISYENQNKLLIIENFLSIDKLIDVKKECDNFLNINSSIDIFSIDIDGNDLYFAKKVSEIFTPKVIVVEYNAKFPPPINISIDYNENHVWDESCYQGASIQAFCDNLKDYTLVSCGIIGLNAYFVHNSFSSAFTSYSIDELYRPPNWSLAVAPVGHPPSFLWLKQELSK